MRLGRTAVVHFVSQALRSVVGFLATWFIATRLGSTVLGEYAVVVALLFWLNVPASAIGSALNKRISEEGDTGPYTAAGHLANAGLTAVIVVALLLANDQVNALVNGRRVAGLVAALVASQTVFQLVVHTLKGTKHVGAAGILKTVEHTLRASFQVAVILVSAGFAWLIVGHAAAIAVSAVAGVGYLRIWPSRPSRSHFRRLLSFARYAWLGMIKSRAFGWMDTIALGVFAGFSTLGLVEVTHGQIGVYEAAWSLASVLGLLSVSISQTLFPELSDLQSRDDYDQVRHLVNEGLAFTGVFTIPGLFGAAVLGGDLLTIYGAEFAQGKWILVVLVGSRLLSSFGSQFVSAINAIDRPDVAFRVNLAFLLVNLVSNVALIAVFGWYGAAVATALSAGLGLVAGGVLFARLVDFSDVPVTEIGYQVGSALLMFGVLTVVKRSVPDTTAAAMALVVLGAAVYGAVLLGVSIRVRRKARSMVSV